ncbi:MAG: TIGR01897 family CRISPR-associated protein [Thermodesulfobacterium geofontis]|uniref:TIGR01897 family CRISPR-associated protein n=1 Tax=Thermodesulfobacterium geofontis TaxID=1295609 RepID=A0A2N7QEW0_9BACT|nr:MAG: TIGR01897 family CRISPR-associated protein [Thermodesulfobacterium geofontis]
MNLIYQIGRFELNAFKPINFQIENQIFSQSLSSLALKEYFTKKGLESKVVLIYPVSLLFNKRVAENSPTLPQSFKEKVLTIITQPDERTAFFSDPYPYFKLHPHSKLADSFTVIHSIGEYEGIKFQVTFEELVFEIFLDIVERYLNEPFKTLYLDISSGLNIYVSALIEAGRLFITFYKLQNFLPEKEPLRVILYFSDPIIQSQLDKTFELHIHYELEVKTFFSWPQLPDQINPENSYPEFIKTLAEEDRKTKKYLTELLAPILTNGYIFFSALKNNTPLVFYTFPYHQEEEVISAIKKLIVFLKNRLLKNFQKTPGLKMDAYRKVFLMLSLYLGIIKALKIYEIFPKSEVSLSELNSKFRDSQNTFFKHFGLISHRAYFAQELENNFYKKEINEKFTEKFKLLKEFISGENQDKDIKDRNFIAHCGFERNCVEVRKENQEIWLRYINDPEKLKKIQVILIKN